MDNLAGEIALLNKEIAGLKLDLTNAEGDLKIAIINQISANTNLLTEKEKQMTVLLQSSSTSGHGVSFPPSFDLEVDSIPEELFGGREGSSAHASKMFKGTKNLSVATWFTAKLVHPVDWKLEHPDSISGSHHFKDHISKFQEKGLKVWDIQNSMEATNRLYVHTTDNKAVTISGRGDYLITRASEHKASYLNRLLCVIEIESSDNEDECTLKLLAYMLILMNTKGLSNLIGFLVFKNGLCRAFRATRQADGACMYEQNDLFHVSHIADMCDLLVTEFRM